jgi:ankyrin repeat protein
VIRYLLEQGADPFVTDVEMNISLHWAAFSGSKGITDLLLSAGCNVNQTNAIGGHAPEDSFRLLDIVIDGHTVLLGNFIPPCFFVRFYYLQFITI